MTPLARPTVPVVVAQHLEDAAALRHTRAVLLRAPQVELKRLARLDERLNAHLDGALVAGDDGYRAALAALESPGAGQLFVAAVLAIERHDAAQIDRLLALAEALPDEAPRALASAFGWASAQSLRGLTAALLKSALPSARWLGIAACAAHRVDPGAVLAAALAAPEPLVRTTALRAAGKLGRVDLLPAVLAQLRADDPTTRAAAAWAAVMLGDGRDGAQALQAMALTRGPAALEALQLGLLAAGPEAARALVRRLASEGAPLRTTLRAAAWAGDVQAVPWLLKQMADDAHARLAGEAFSFLTGADLALLDLERKEGPPAAGGPNEDPDDADVALDEDESLPWPDVGRVQAWWNDRRASMPAGQRCFMGAAAGAEHCTAVLRTGGQRQRYAAALLLSLMKPGTALFNVAAPAWRQQRALGLPMRVT
jgi:uncharacterized protein (TIGR02270 family)